VRGPNVIQYNQTEAFCSTKRRPLLSFRFPPQTMVPSTSPDRVLNRKGHVDSDEIAPTSTLHPHIHPSGGAQPGAAESHRRATRRHHLGSAGYLRLWFPNADAHFPTTDPALSHCIPHFQGMHNLPQFSTICTTFFASETKFFGNNPQVGSLGIRVAHSRAQRRRMQ
jgi:hypothetical protein